MDAKALTATGLQHLGLPVSDMDKSISFYENLGLVLQWRADRDAAVQVAFVALGNLVLEIYPAAKKISGVGVLNHFSINVTDVEAAFSLVKGAGHRLLDKEIQFLPFLAKGVRFFTFLGPDEEKIEMNEILQ